MTRNIEGRGPSFLYNLKAAIGVIAMAWLALSALRFCHIALPESLQWAVLGASVPLGLWVGFRRDPAPRSAPGPYDRLPIDFVPITDVDEYGRFVEEIWLGDGPLDDRQLTVMSLGLGGETGEVLELIKKSFRDNTLDRDLLRKELGDVAYYLFRIGLAYGFKPSEILGANRHKLVGRLARGTLQGSGDLR